MCVLTNTMACSCAACRDGLGYGVLLEAVARRLGAAPPPRRLLLCALGLLLEEPPPPGALPRFASSDIANPAALQLLLALLRRAAAEDQLWGLAAFRELLLQVRAFRPLLAACACSDKCEACWHGCVPQLTRLPVLALPVQGVHNLAAADGAGINRQLVAWLGETADDEAGEQEEEVGDSGGELAPEGQQQQQQRRLLQQQLLALLRLSGSYSISGGCRLPLLTAGLASTVAIRALGPGNAVFATSQHPILSNTWTIYFPMLGPFPLCVAARDLRSLLHLLKPGGDGRPPLHSAMLLEVSAWLTDACCCAC